MDPIIAKPKPIKLPKRHEKLYEEIMADDVINRCTRGDDR